MKKITTSLLTIGLLMGLQTNAQTKKTTKPQPKKVAVASAPKKVMTEEEMQKAWMEYATPNEIHKMIAGSDGTWSGQVTHWMKPGDEGIKSDGKCNNRMIMGGRYQMSEFTGNMMGMPFEGMGLLGYDNLKKVYINTWVDNMGTGVTTMEGVWNKETNSITFKGKMVDPMSGKEVPVREVFKIVSEDKQILEMYGPTPDGKGEFKTMEIVFKRG